MENDDKLRYFLRRVTADLTETRRRLQEREAVDGEPIAVVGMSCRFPGGVDSPERLWRLVAEGRDAVSAFPADRGWDTEDLYDPDPDALGKTYAREGGFLHDADRFDAAFFGIGPREALAMDPQQRLLLETAWEAWERAGIDPAAVRGSRTGVFVGTGHQEYAALVQRATENFEGYLLSGGAASVISGRLSYVFGLEGPAVTVDTACSSSLVALHLACQALRRGECELALTGGAAVMASPGMFVEFARQRGLAPDGRCKAFAAAADGTGWGEGVGLLLVERLSDARRNGHPVLAVVRGSAVNQDGASNGLTAPNGPSQQRVIWQALADARLSAGDIDAVEAHGTGTALGDPIEAQALLATYGQDRPADRPLWLGSVKSNIGHTQAAAGVAGVIKMVMALRHAELPRTLHVDAPSPHVDWSAGAVELLTEHTGWPAAERPRRAGVSSFGVSGTNAHVILEQAPDPEPESESEPGPEPATEAPKSAGEDPTETEAGTSEGRAKAGPARTARAKTELGKTELGKTEGASQAPVDGDTPTARGAVAGASVPWLPWLVSAKDERALRAQAGRLAEFVTAHPELDPADVGWSLATTRGALEHRAVLVVADRDDVAAALRGLAEGDAAPPGAVTGRAADGGRPVFVFPGQGAQWVGMAVELLDTSPVFAARVAACEAALSGFVDWSLTAVLRGVEGAPGLDRVDVVQPVLWAVMVSLAALWRSFGVEPAAVVGHSQGEIAAAVVAGGLSLEDGARVVALRSRALSVLAGRGGMVSLALPREAAEELLTAWGGRITVAALNGPASVVVSGDADALDELTAACERREIRARRVEVDYASHSPHVEAIEAELAEALAPVAPRTGQIPFRSTVTGDWLDTAALDAGYWYTNLRETVRLEPAVRALAGLGHTAFVEISPHPVLTAALEETVDAADARAVVVGSLRRDEGGWRRFLTSLAEAHARGVTVDWAPAFAGRPRRRVELPTYAFQRRRFWVDTLPATSSHALAKDSAEDPDTAADALRRRLATLSPAERDRAVAELLETHIAAVLGIDEPIERGRPFTQLGFVSLTAVELRNRLNAATGLRLPATVVFDHPTPEELGGRLLTDLLGTHPETAAPAPAAVTVAADDDPVAIVGMACRFPGGVASPEDLWRLVDAGEDAISAFPANRGWDIETLYDPDPERAGRTYTREGGFIADADEFDAALFGISPREALAMDPQQRLLLETAWEAFERAGIAPESLRGSRTGVFAGSSGQDYTQLMIGAAAAGVEGYALTGNAASVISGRLAYTFGLEGPAVTVDTACSSSLVALHLACQSVRSGESSLALAAGVTVLSTPLAFIGFSRQRGLAPDGRCKAFSAAADGTAWGEGAGVVLVERLSDARRNGHPVLAVVRSTATNQDGASNGLAAPNGPSQQRVIRQALANARLTAAEVDAVEAHGTGTALGDPIEAQALLATYGEGRPADRPLWLGTVKSNIGHTAAAAGLAGVIKMVLAMDHGVLPRTLHAEEPTPHVDWSTGAVSLLDRAVPWPDTGRPRRAGVSSFGVSGTNAHAIIEQAPPAEPADSAASDPAASEAPGDGDDAPSGGVVAASAAPGRGVETPSDPDPDAVPAPVPGRSVSVDPSDAVPDAAGTARPAPVVPWLLSAKSRAALRAQAARLREHLAERPGSRPVDVGWSLATTRSALEHRAAVVAGDRDALLAGLDALAAGRAASGLVHGVAAGGRTAFLFPGQGSQRPGMGRELHAAHPVFAVALDEVCAELDRRLGAQPDRPLREVMFAPEGSADAALLDETVYTQPALFALGVALARLLESWGVVPDYVSGHSLGELTAAHVAGVLSLPDACELVAVRARLMHSAPDGGAMVALEASEDEVVPLLAGREDQVSVSAVNAPRATVVSGAEAAVAELAAAFAARGRRTRRVRIARAAHSPLMDGVLAEFGRAVAGLSYAAPRIPLVSNLTGDRVGREVRSPEHWVRHLREAVRFGDGVRRMASDGVTRCLELGPGGVLSALVQDRDTDPDASVAAVPLLRRDRPESESLLTGLAQAHTLGVRVDWRSVLGGFGARRVALPTYAFQRRRYWPDWSPALGTETATGAPAADAPSRAATPSAAAAQGAGTGAGLDEVEGPAALRARLAGLSAAERDATVRELVAAEVAAVLGHPTTEEVEHSVGLPELGFDSLAATELRNGLGAATGLPLAASVVFDHPTLKALTAHLLDGLEAAWAPTAGEGPSAPSGAAPAVGPSTAWPSTAGARGGAPGGESTLTSLALRAARLDRFGEIRELLMTASRFRPAFDASAPPPAAPAPVRLSHGPHGPRILCFPSFAGRSAAQQYARLGTVLRGQQDLWALPAPGFTAGEPIPADLDALALLHAEEARRCAGGEPFVILGHSSGGWVAHEVAARLEEQGTPPTAVVLLDSYRPDGAHLPQVYTAVAGRLMGGQGAASPSTGEQWDDDCLTAMGGYDRLFADWRPKAVAAPTLLLRAVEPLPGYPAEDWRASWQLAHTAVDVPGDHFTVIGEHAPDTLRAMADWLSTLP
ncbi:type I polyketide synthase [Streptomyces sp. LX-29]|uniref:type I polyketide synthase n=1 Tax=Streptomyces sp. LX-29 TaxID=2900152 RepID=UPI00240DAB48|nr:type I polyketide synthase [Streptomyces sp. LX-29]